MARQWTPEENEAVVRAYFGMAAQEMRGEDFSKVSVYRSVAHSTGRGAKAVEFKFLNVSGVLKHMGFGHVRGLLPYENYQSALRVVVEEALESHPQVREYLEATGDRQTQVHTEDVEPEPVPAAIDDGREPEAAPDIAHLNVRQGGRMKVTDLWNYATGGSEVAALPGHELSGPVGPRPAGVEEAVAWMQEAFQSHYRGNRRFLFLVGGPGGGKSDVAARLTSELEPLTDASDGLAHRIYRYRSDGGPVLLVNDATIPSEGGRRAEALADDITSASPSHFIGCVNRGVLVDESLREDSESLGGLVTGWLRSEPTHERNGWSLESFPQGTSFLKQARIVGPDEVIEAVAVFVDVCSLLELRPEVQLENGVLEVGKYKISRFSKSKERSESPAGVLLTQVAETLDWDSGSESDPIAANLTSLQSQSVRDGVLSILRAAELASSQRFSYRQIWGIIARLVAGPLPEQINPSQLIRWLDSEKTKGTGGVRALFDSLRSLARVRLHESLFGDDWAPSTRHPILDSTVIVDPSRDMKPGHPKDSGFGWATPISDAFASGGDSHPPLEGLIGSADSRKLNEFVTPFDHLLDGAFMDAVSQDGDRRWKAEATAWYGRYLARMLAVAHGFPAHAAHIDSWTNAWDLSPSLPEELAQRILIVLRPPRHAGEARDKSQVPLFASRAEPVQGTPDEPTLVVALKSFDLSTRKEGEDLELVVAHGGNHIGRVRLDLDIVREAAASGSNWLGLTDATESIVPRLERFRSLNLTSQSRDVNAVRIIIRDKDYSLSADPDRKAAH